MSYNSNYKIDEIDEVSSKSKAGSKWHIYQEYTEQAAAKPSKLKQVAKEVNSFWLALLAFLIALLIALGFALGMSFASQGVGTGSTALAMPGTLLAIASSAVFVYLAASIRSNGKYLSESMSNNSFSHHNKRDWNQLDDADDDAIELKKVR